MLVKICKFYTENRRSQNHVFGKDSTSTPVKIKHYLKRENKGSVT